MRAGLRIWIGVLVASWLAACGPGQQETTRPDEGKTTAAQPAKPPRPSLGPTFEVSFSVMAAVLHTAEGVSVWRQDISRKMYRAFDDRFGLDEADKGLLKKFALIRYDLWERGIKSKPKVTFQKPFGPEGLFPVSEAGLQDRFWNAVLAASEPAVVRRSLGGVVEPTDAETISSVLGQLAPRVGEIISGYGGYQEAIGQIQSKLASGGLPELFDSLGKFAGVSTRSLVFRVHPVWMPEGTKPKATAYGDVIVLGLVEGEPVGPVHVAEIARAVCGRILARLEPRTKALVSSRFVELAGFRDWPFPLTQALQDAAGYGLAAPLVASGPAEVPTWPGKEDRQRGAEAMTSLLRDWLAKGKKLDGVFALKAAKAYAKVNPARPSDFVDGALVIAHDNVLKPFKEKVSRWVVWKFPLTGKYNFPRKLDYTPGRSVLMVMTPKDLKIMPEKFPGRPKVQKAFETAYASLKSNKGVIVTLKRESRGFIFVVAATGPEAMQRVAKAFFDLESVPGEIVEIK